LLFWPTSEDGHFGLSEQELSEHVDGTVQFWTPYCCLATGFAAASFSYPVGIKEFFGRT
jgi:hypothetical protein